MSIKLCIPKGKTRVRVSPNSCVVCKEYFCRNNFTGMLKVSCGLPFACNKCIERLPAETKDKFVREMKGMTIANMVLLIIALSMVFGALILVMSVLTTHTFDLGILFTALGIIFSAMPLMCVGIFLPFGMRAKALKAFGIPK
jgi:hypothetical protein